MCPRRPSAVLGEDTFGFDHWSDGGERVTPLDVDPGAPTSRPSTGSTRRRTPPVRAAAPRSTAPSGARRPGRLASGTDVDWYRFTVPRTRSVQIMLATCRQAASLKLYKGCSTLLDDVGPDGDQHRGDREVAVGRAPTPIKVTSKGASSDDPYVLRIKRLCERSVGPVVDEPGRRWRRDADARRRGLERIFDHARPDHGDRQAVRRRRPSARDSQGERRSCTPSATAGRRSGSTDHCRPGSTTSAGR